MRKGCVLAALATVLAGCAMPTAAWRGPVDWPDEHSAKLVGQPMEAGAALAAAAAVREMVRENLATDPGLFWGCSSPEQGLDVAIFTGPTPGLYFVVLHQRFNRCGGPSGRVLDGWYEYAVTPQGEVVGKAPPPSGEALEDSAPPSNKAADSPAPPPAEPPPAVPQTPPPAAPSPSLPPLALMPQTTLTSTANPAGGMFRVAHSCLLQGLIHVRRQENG